MKKAYVWLVGPVLAAVVGWALSGNWKLGLWLFFATGLGNYIAYRASLEP